jgi:hypothetical protein
MSNLQTRLTQQPALTDTTIGITQRLHGYTGDLPRTMDNTSNDSLEQNVAPPPLPSFLTNHNVAESLRTANALHMQRYGSPAVLSTRFAPTVVPDFGGLVDFRGPLRDSIRLTSILPSALQDMSRLLWSHATCPLSSYLVKRRPQSFRLLNVPSFVRRTLSIACPSPPVSSRPQDHSFGILTLLLSGLATITLLQRHQLQSKAAEETSSIRP